MIWRYSPLSVAKVLCSTYVFVKKPAAPDGMVDFCQQSFRRRLIDWGDPRNGRTAVTLCWWQMMTWGPIAAPSRNVISSQRTALCLPIRRFFRRRTCYASDKKSIHVPSDETRRSRFWAALSALCPGSEIKGEKPALWCKICQKKNLVHCAV